MCPHHGHTHHCGLALSTEQSQRDAEIIFFLFSFFPSFVSSLLLALSHPPSFLLSLSVDAGCYQHSEKSFIKMTLIKTLSPKSFSGPGRGHWVRSVPPSLSGSRVRTSCPWLARAARSSQLLKRLQCVLLTLPFLQKRAADPRGTQLWA